MKVLIAEDHPRLARSMAEGLREESYAVDIAFDGLEADRMVGENDYDCMVLDITLPGCNGWEVLRNVRSRGSELPVLCLTARDTVEDRVRGLDLGADDYMVKPFEWDELLARVRALIRRSHGNPNPVLTIADLTIDLSRRSVQRAGVSIELSVKEYALLEYLAHRQDIVVTRIELWEHLYDSNDELRSNVIDVFVAMLRKKIDRGFSSPLIQTRRGLGYVLTDCLPSN